MAKKRKKKIAKKLLRFTLAFVLLAMLTAILAGVAICITTEPIDASLLNMKMTSVLYYEDDNGEQVIMQNLYSGENRSWVNFDEIPLDMKNAFVAIEDERFYSHPGFDIKRLTGAGLNTILRLFDKNRSVYGGSTITQQLVKNLTKEDDRSILRKFREIYRAIRLEKDLSKNDILELYLNTIYLSQNCNGVGSASKIYFDKDISELNLAECASIAGITQYPSLYDPYLNPEANKEKQLTVLSKMLELEMITQEEYDEAVSYELIFERAAEFDTSYYSYFVDTVIEEVLEDLETRYNYSPAMAQNLLYTGGLQIKCTIDPEIQAILESVYEDEANFIRNADGELLQSSMVVIEAVTGEVKGVVGGIGDKGGSRTYNRATAPRQPGSSIKPISVYAPALDFGIIHSGSVLNDVKTTFTLEDGTTWTPRNSGGYYSGPVSLKTAISRSLNVPAAQVLHDMGIERSYEFLTEDLGISTLVESRKTDEGIISDKSLAPLSLGGLTDGISPIEMAAAYTPFISKGYYTEAHTYTEIYDYNGNLLYSKHPLRHRAIRSSTATIMAELLSGVVTGGTGSSARFSGVDLAGKTGTTTNNHDKWFVGFTPSLIGATWVGYDTPTNISVSGNPAINLWKKVMSQIDYEDKPHRFEDVLSFDNLQRCTLCTVSGLRATSVCTALETTYRVYMEEDVAYSIKKCTPEEHISEEELEALPGTDGTLTSPENGTATGESTITPSSPSLPSTSETATTETITTAPEVEATPSPEPPQVPVPVPSGGTVEEI
ncbi:MAG: PBP1A family penicillin-binding protein [Clostridia bacterium]|nr:PBP1A family penicillin-binding protein [Clostridia bacterium]